MLAPGAEPLEVLLCGVRRLARSVIGFASLACVR